MNSFSAWGCLVWSVKPWVHTANSTEDLKYFGGPTKGNLSFTTRKFELVESEILLKYGIWNQGTDIDSGFTAWNLEFRIQD